MHKVAPEVQHAIGIPQLHIVDPCAEAAIADGANTLGLLVTAPVMETGFYRARFADFGFEVLVLAERDCALVHRAIFEELTRGIVQDHSAGVPGDHGRPAGPGRPRHRARMHRDRSPGHRKDMPGTALYDTKALHVDRAVRISLGLHPLMTDPV